MARAGEGYRFHMTGLTHDEKGYPDMTVAAQAKLLGRLIDKIKKNAAALTDVVADGLEDADVVVVSYGITSRVALPAIAAARGRGLKVGSLRLRDRVAVPRAPGSGPRRPREGVRRARAEPGPDGPRGGAAAPAGRACVGVPHAGGTVHNPAVIEQAITEALR